MPLFLFVKCNKLLNVWYSFRCLICWIITNPIFTLKCNIWEKYQYIWVTVIKICLMWIKVSYQYCIFAKKLNRVLTCMILFNIERAFFKSTLRFGENFGPTLRFGKIFHLLYGSTRFALKEARAATGWFFFIVLRD